MDIIYWLGISIFYLLIILYIVFITLQIIKGYLQIQTDEGVFLLINGIDNLFLIILSFGIIIISNDGYFYSYKCCSSSFSKKIIKFLFVIITVFAFFWNVRGNINILNEKISDDFLLWSIICSYLFCIINLFIIIFI